MSANTDTNLIYLSQDGLSVSYGLWSERGVRKFMEDTHVLCPSYVTATMSKVNVPTYLDAMVFGIFDGHGGRQTATFVRDKILFQLATTAVSLLETHSSKVVNNSLFDFDDAFVSQLMRKTFIELDAQLSEEYPNCKDGCTVILAFIPLYSASSNKVYVASLGDAAAYLGRIEGDLQAIVLNEIHKPWIIKEKERIYKAGGTVESGRVNGILEVSRSLGDLSLKKFGVICIPTLMKFSVSDMKQDFFVVLACDGFWVNWTTIEAMNKAYELLMKEERRLTSLEQNPQTQIDLRTVCQQLVEHVLVEKKSQDNVSVILLKFNVSKRD